MKNETEEFKGKMEGLLNAYSKKETEFLKRLKNNSGQDKKGEKYPFMPTAKEFEEHINKTLKGLGISYHQIDNNEENER